MEWRTSVRCYSAALIALIPDRMIQMSSETEQQGHKRRPFRKAGEVLVRRCFNNRMNMMGLKNNQVIQTIDKGCKVQYKIKKIIN